MSGIRCSDAIGFEQQWTRRGEGDVLKGSESDTSDDTSYDTWMMVRRCGTGLQMARERGSQVAFGLGLWWGRHRGQRLSFWRVGVV
jgi:hypothetical protein